MEIDETEENLLLNLRDEVKRLASIKVSAKPKSIHMVLGNGGELRVAVILANNTIELYNLQSSLKDNEAKCLRSVTNQGHHSEVKSVSFSSDSLAVVSGCGEAIKMWNRPTQSCLRTIKTG